MKPVIQRLGESELELAKKATAQFLDEGEVVTNDERLAGLLKKDDFYFVTALLEGEVIGRLTAYEFELYKDNTKEMYLYEIDVVEAHKQQGVATELIEFTKALCKARGVSCIFVGTEPDNIPAQKLYLKTGAKLEGNLPHFTYEID